MEQQNYKNCKIKYFSILITRSTFIVPEILENVLIIKDKAKRDKEICTAKVKSIACNNYEHNDICL